MLCVGKHSDFNGVLMTSDVRDWSAYNSGHVVLARNAQKWLSETKDLHLPYNIHLPTTRHCVVYDNNTVSNFEESKEMPFLVFAVITSSLHSPSG